MKGPRARNEDRTFVLWSGPRHDRPPMLVAGLLDGIGGMEVGDLAATAAAAHFLAAFLEDQGHIDGASALGQVLELALARANAAVCDLFKGAGGTTLTVFAMTRDWCVAIHVGDSRLYRISPRIAQITRDGPLAGAFAYEKPDLFASGVLQSVGVGSSAHHQIYDLTADCPRRLLLTSDGVHNLGPRVLQRLVRGPWSEERLKADEAYWNLLDNASAVYVRTKYARRQLDWCIPYELRLICGKKRTSFMMS